MRPYADILAPLKLILPGEYFDSRLYAGRLYLWQMDGSIRVLNWDRLVDSVAVPPRLRLALECGFKRSDRLYGSSWDRHTLFGDEEIREVLVRKFDDLAQQPIRAQEWDLRKAELRRAEVHHRDNPFPFPHSDCLIYDGRLHLGSPQGVFSTVVQGKHPDLAIAIKRWDGPTVGISAGYRQLALSAGSEGLFALPAADVLSPRRPERLSALHSATSHWAFYSVFSSSPLHAGYLVDYEMRKEEQPEAPDWRKAGMLAERPAEELSDQRRERSFRGVLRAEEIFRRSSFSWGSQEKLCQANEDQVLIVRYLPSKTAYDERFQPLGDIRFQRAAKTAPISADSAVFGYVLEFEDSLLVLKSSGEEYLIPGEPVSWRVFPRSRFYENHLHVIREDRLEIYSFNDDYLLDQKTKLAGIEYRPPTMGRAAA